jgi:hypothetical protein
MFAALTLGLVFWVLVFVGTCVVTIQWMTKSVDLTRECGPGRTKDCVSREAGRVVKVGEASAVTVAYRDETRRTQLTLTSSPVPAVGTRVWLERWNGELVSLLERESELRHHTDDWPAVSFEAVFTVVASVVVGGIPLGLYLRWLRRRLTRSHPQVSET